MMRERPYCEVCNNTGAVDCHCGGDNCVCENYGEKPCPKCDGKWDDDDDDDMDEWMLDPDMGAQG